MFFGCTWIRKVDIKGWRRLDGEHWMVEYILTNFILLYDKHIYIASVWKKVCLSIYINLYTTLEDVININNIMSLRTSKETGWKLLFSDVGEVLNKLIRYNSVRHEDNFYNIEFDHIFWMNSKRN